LGKNSKKNKMNTKTTAVQYLFEKLWETPKDKLTWNAIFKVAKQMEQYQIEEAFDEGKDSEYEYHINDEPRMGAEQYYKETYEQ
jgi:hypothetical protein